MGGGDERISMGGGEEVRGLGVLLHSFLLLFHIYPELCAQHVNEAETCAQRTARVEDLL